MLKMKKEIKRLDFIKNVGYTISNILATPPKLRFSAHFGRVFSFVEHTRRASAVMQAKFGGFSFLVGCYGKI